MPYSERSSIRPEAANYAVGGGSDARVTYHVQKSYCRWYILCGPSCVYISRPYWQFSWRDTFHIVMAPIIIRTPPFPECVITLSFFLNDATYTCNKIWFAWKYRCDIFSSRESSLYPFDFWNIIFIIYISRKNFVKENLKNRGIIVFHYWNEWNNLKRDGKWKDPSNTSQ